MRYPGSGTKWSTILGEPVANKPLRSRWSERLKFVYLTTWRMLDDEP
jgi:hypothetical protein